MKRFSFALERVLGYRRQVEEVERARLAGLALRRSDLLAQARLAQQESQTARRMVQNSPELPHVPSRQRRAPPIQGMDLRWAYEYAASMQRYREQIIAQADRTEADWRRQLAVVLEGRRKTRLLELLRAKKLRQHRRLSGREQETLDGELHLAKLSAKKL